MRDDQTLCRVDYEVTYGYSFRILAPDTTQCEGAQDLLIEFSWHLEIVAMLKSLLQPYLTDDSLRSKIKNLASRVGFDTTDWLRVIMYRRCFSFIESIRPETLDVLEISGGPQWRRKFKFGSYVSTDFPEFDVCAEVLGRQFDLIIADQVFEHLPWPIRAGRNVYAMLRPGGYLIIATPFLVRVHEVPIDCSRWTEQGLSYLLQECGFGASEIKTDSWGNRKCLRANLSKWRRYGFYRSLTNESNFPVMVWAIARKQMEAS